MVETSEKSDNVVKLSVGKVRFLDKQEKRQKFSEYFS